MKGRGSATREFAETAPSEDPGEMRATSTMIWGAEKTGRAYSFPEGFKP
jgi:hypothetical protein